jgi:AraC-like DNA-binding protein
LFAQPYATQVSESDDADDEMELPKYGGGPLRLRDPKLLRRAKLLLSAGQAVSDVATACGYSSTAAFSNAFLAVVDKRPGEFAREGGSPQPRKQRTGGYAGPKHRERVVIWTEAEIRAAKRAAERDKRRRRKKKRVRSPPKPKPPEPPAFSRDAI